MWYLNQIIEACPGDFGGRKKADISKFLFKLKNSKFFLKIASKECPFEEDTFLFIYFCDMDKWWVKRIWKVNLEL